MKTSKKIIIFADTREAASEILNELGNYDCVIKKKLLHIADFLCSDRVAIERKTSSDFVSSIMDQRLFNQLKTMKDTFENPLLIIEGDDLYEKVSNPNIIRGALTTVTVNLGIPIIWTHDSKETAGQIFWIAKREQIMEKRELPVRPGKRTETMEEKQEYLIHGLPGISMVRASALLKHFRTPQAIFDADEKELAKVEGIGKITAKRIKEVLKSRYK